MEVAANAGQSLVGLCGGLCGGGVDLWGVDPGEASAAQAGEVERKTEREAAESSRKWKDQAHSWWAFWAIQVEGDKMEGQCLCCERNYSLRRAGQKYCSPICQSRASGRLKRGKDVKNDPAKTCPRCDRQFTGFNGQVCCSDRCCRKWRRRKKRKKFCPNCNKRVTSSGRFCTADCRCSFMRKLKEKKCWVCSCLYIGRSQYFCSSECKKKYRRLPTDLLCPQCGKTFYRIGTQIFCTRSCKKTYHRRLRESAKLESQLLQLSMAVHNSNKEN